MKFPKNGQYQVDTCFSDLFPFFFDLIATPVEQPKMNLSVRIRTFWVYDTKKPCI